MLKYDTIATTDDETHEIASDAQVGASSDGHASEDEHSDADQEHSSHASEEHGNHGHDEGDHGHDDHGHDDHGHGEHGHGEHHEHDYLGQDHLMGHVLDSEHFEVSGWLLGDFKDGTKHINIPQPFKTETPLIGKEDTPILPLDLKVTKFMVIETLVALALVAVFVPLARRIKTGDRPRGRFWNLFEVILFYIRDEVARPAIGKTDGDKYLPYLWTIFFFVLFCNLFGLIPFLGSPTGSLATTGVLAAATLIMVLGTGFKKMGVVGFFVAQVPHMDLPPALAIVIKPMIWVIEVVGLFMKHIVLAIRLFANMFAGHLVLAVLLAFIGVTFESGLVYLVAPGAVGVSVAVNMLEIFVAFLQAYIFTFLSALFIGFAAHPH
ncbi:MAG: F0F1 ATP synthase subunit A [Planctomycetota bacterium]|nr:F0F1 ATP synthase subunit A [Planctomycetota bacterium]